MTNGKAVVDASELLDSQSPIAGDLEQGLRIIALNQEIEFKLYARLVLPADGYVFWVAAPLLARQPFQPPGLFTAQTLSEEEMANCCVKSLGSLHYSGDFRQEESENYVANRVVFTSKQEVNQLNDVASDKMWIGEFRGLRFGFSAQAGRFFQADLWHYSGFAIYADMQKQIVDSAPGFDSSLIVSNSLPAWLMLSRYNPPWAFWKPLPTLFPSFLAPDNEPPNYGTVHIIPEQTRYLASAPTLDRATQSQVQLAEDTVRVTLWGQNNAAAMDFVAAVNDFATNIGAFGIMDIGTPHDEKRIQPEIRTIAQKKTLDFRVSYLQGTVRNKARQIIRAVTPTLAVDHKQVSSSSNA